MRFEGDKSLELDVTWAINQPPRRQGTVCRLHADQGAIEVYTPHGPVLYRKFGAKGEANEAPLKTPKVIGYHAMMRNFRACIAGTSKPVFSAGDGVALMQMIEAIYKSAASGKSVEIRGGRENETVEPSV